MSILTALILSCGFIFETIWHSPNWPQTCSIAQEGIELFTLHVLGVQEFSTIFTLQDWGSNPGLHICKTSILPTELYLQPHTSSLIPSLNETWYLQVPRCHRGLLISPSSSAPVHVRARYSFTVLSNCSFFLASWPQHWIHGYHFCKFNLILHR